jgi:hypothetical protein
MVWVWFGGRVMAEKDKVPLAFRKIEFHPVNDGSARRPISYNFFEMEGPKISIGFQCRFHGHSNKPLGELIPVTGNVHTLLLDENVTGCLACRVVPPVARALRNKGVDLISVIHPKQGTIEV